MDQNYLFEKYNGEEPLPPNPQQTAISSWLTPIDQNAPFTPEQQEQVTADLADATRVGWADQILRDDNLLPEVKVEALAPVAEQMGEPKTAEAVVGLHNKLAFQAGDATNPAVATSIAWRARQQAALQKYASEFGKFEGKLLERNELAGNPLVSTLAQTGEGFLSVLRSTVSPDATLRVSNIMSKYAPTTRWYDYLAPAELYNAVGRELRNMKPAEQDKAIQEILSAISAEGFWGTDNNYERQQQLQAVRSAIFDDTAGLGTNLLNLITVAAPALAPLDIATAGSQAYRGLVSKSLELGQQTGKLPTAATLRGDFQGAAELLQDARVAEATLPEEVGAEAAKEAYKGLNVGVKDIRAKRVDGGWEVKGKGAAAQVFPDDDLVRRAAPAGSRTEPGTFVPEGAVPIKPVTAGPAIAVGTVADAATLTRAGAKSALDAAYHQDAEALLSARDATPDQVVGSLELPKFIANKDEWGRPYVSMAQYTPEMEESVKRTVNEGLRDVLQVRLKDVVMGKRLDNGFEYEALIGNAKGTGYALDREEYVRGLADEQFGKGNYEIVKSEPIGAETKGELFIKIKGVAEPTLANIKGTQQLVRNPWLRFFGRESAFTQYFNKPLSAANRATDVAAAKVNTWLEPYYKLGRVGRQKVNLVIEEGDMAHKTFTREELIVKGLDDSEITAYFNYDRLRQSDLGVTNFNVRERMLADKWRFGKLGDTDTLLRPVDRPKNLKNAVTQDNKPVSALEAGDQVFELLEPVGKTTHVVVKNGVKNPFTLDLPQQIVKNVPGYMIRKYEYPFFIRNVDEGKFVRGATSRKEAEAYINTLKAENPEGNYDTFLASEIDPGSKAILADDILRLKEQNLFRVQPRRPDVLLGVDGKPRLVDVQTGIEMMTQRTIGNAGVNRFVTATLRQLNNRVAQYGAKFSLGAEPVIPAGRVSEAARKELDDAQTVFNHLELMAGISMQFTFKPIQAARVKLADFFYNRKMLGIGNELSGLTNKTASGLRSAAFFSYLGTNVFRNPLTQTSMIPVYAGLKGVGRYALSGRFAYDLGGLAEGVLRGKRPSGDAGELYDLWQKTGLQSGIKNHLLVSQSIFDSGSRLGPALDGTIGTALRGLKAAGFDAGTTLDKMGALVAATKRWRVANEGRWPKTELEIDEIAHDAEALTFNQNRTDPLLTQKGMLGLATQFMSYQIKATARLLGQEGPWSTAERVRMGLTALMTYGVDGLRMGTIINQIEHKIGQELDPRAEEIIRQGAYGTVFNTTLGLLTDPKGEFGKWTEGEDNGGLVNVSGSVGPFNFVGASLDTLTEVFNFSASDASFISFMPPSAGLLVDVYEAAKFGALLGGVVGPGLDIPVGNKLAAITSESLRNFPIANNLFKSYAMMRYGQSIDRSGSPVSEATYREALAAIAGLPAYDDEQIREAQRALYGEFAGATPDAISGSIKAQAKEDAAWIVKSLNAFKQGELSYLDVVDILEKRAYAMNDLFGDDTNARDEYYSTLMNEYQKRGVMKDKRLVEAWITGVSSGRIALNQKTKDQLGAIDFPGKAEVLEYIKDQEDIRFGANQLLNGNE